jgi:nucleoside-diphosphate kinase
MSFNLRQPTAISRFFAVAVVLALLFGQTGCESKKSTVSSMQQTIIILKPDAIQGNLVGSLLARFETAHLRIAALKMVRLNEQVLREHYAHLLDRPFFGEISAFMQESPVVLVLLEGENAIAVVREMVGPTNPASAAKGTIRGDLGTTVMRNMVHASDSPAGATAEIARFFSPDEIFPSFCIDVRQ